MTGTANWSNVSKNVNSIIGANITWRVHANDSADQWNVSSTYSYTTLADQFYSVTLITPADGYNTTDITPTHTFSYDATYPTASCTLYYDSTEMVTNSSVLEGVTTTMTIGSNQFDNQYEWWVTCINGTDTLTSDTRNIIIDLSTTYTLTFNFTPYSEIINISIPRRTDVTSASFNMTGYQITRGTQIDMHTGICNGITDYFPLKMITDDGSYLYLGCEVSATPNRGFLARLFMNGTYTGTKWNLTESSEVTSKVFNAVYTNGTDIWIATQTPERVYQFNMTMDYIQNFTPARGYFGLTGNDTHFFAQAFSTTYVLNSTFDELSNFSTPVSSNGITTDNEFIWVKSSSRIYKLNMDGTDADINFSIPQGGSDLTHNNNDAFYTDSTNSFMQVIVLTTSFPENVTIDAGDDGILDYINWTEFSTTETIIFNATGLEAINSYLQNVCTADWATGNCDVPFNVSSVAGGILGISGISWSGVSTFGIFNISILDEMTGDPFNISEFDSVLLSFFCDNETQNVTITEQGQDATVVCEPNEVRITVTELGDAIIRYLVPESNFANLDFYVYNSTEETDVTQDWLFFDVTGLYENGIAQVEKVIFDTGEKIMIQKIIDSESKARFFLVVNEKYCFTVFDSAGGNERNLGCMDADADTEKRISISTVPFAPDQAIAYQDVFVSFSWDNDTAIIQALYNDTLGLTSNVTFIVYNASNSSQVLYWATSSNSVVTFTYNNVDVLTTHLARIIAVHDIYGTIDPMQMIDFGGKYRVAGLGSLGLGIWMSIAGGMIATFVMMAFGKRFAKIGSAVFVIMIIIFMQWGWFEESPQITWGMITLIAFIVFVNVITLKRRLQ